jgi:hypothetical protein
MVTGAIVGNRGGTQTKLIKNLGIKLLVANRPTPSVALVVARNLTEGSEEINRAKTQVQNFCDRLEQYLHNEEPKGRPAKKSSSDTRKTPRKRKEPVQTQSTADEINKLVNLRDSGVISQEDFEHMKKSLIAKAS